MPARRPRLLLLNAALATVLDLDSPRRILA